MCMYMYTCVHTRCSTHMHANRNVVQSSMLVRIAPPICCSILRGQGRALVCACSMRCMQTQLMMYTTHMLMQHRPYRIHMYHTMQCNASMVLNMLFTLAQLIVTDTGTVSEQNRISQPDCTYDMSRDRSRSPDLPRIPSREANAAGTGTLYNASTRSARSATSSNTQHTTYSKLAC